MFANWQKRWHRSRIRSLLFTRKTKNTTSVSSNMSRQDVQFNTLHYQSINDCPIWNYNQAIEKNDSRYLYILTNYNNLPEKRLDKILDSIWWEYLDEKGIDPNFKLAYEYKIKIAELEFEQACGSDKRIQIEMAKMDLKSMLSHKSQKLSEQIAILSKFMGYQLDPKKITVFDFIGIEKLFADYGKAKSTVTR